MQNGIEETPRECDNELINFLKSYRSGSLHLRASRLPRYGILTKNDMKESAPHVLAEIFKVSELLIRWMLKQLQSACAMCLSQPLAHNASTRVVHLRVVVHFAWRHQVSKFTKTCEFGFETWTVVQEGQGSESDQQASYGLAQGTLGSASTVESAALTASDNKPTETCESVKLYSSQVWRPIVN